MTGTLARTVLPAFKQKKKIVSLDYKPDFLKLVNIYVFKIFFLKIYYMLIDQFDGTCYAWYHNVNIFLHIIG